MRRLRNKYLDFRGEDFHQLWSALEDDLFRHFYLTHTDRQMSVIFKNRRTISCLANRLWSGKSGLPPKKITRRAKWIQLLCRPHTAADVAREMNCRIRLVYETKDRLRKQGYPVIPLPKYDVRLAVKAHRNGERATWNWKFRHGRFHGPQDHLW